MTCKHTGCNAPEGECSGACLSANGTDIYTHPEPVTPVDAGAESDEQLALRIARGMNCENDSAAWGKTYFFEPRELHYFALRFHTEKMKQLAGKPFDLTASDLTHIYNDANGITGGKNPPISTERIFKAMTACFAAGAASVKVPEGWHTDAAMSVMAERDRQKSAEGWTPEHDDEHSTEELAFAASCYATADQDEPPPAVWPWAREWWKPAGRRRSLVKAGALILAEIERLDRAMLSAAPTAPGEWK